MYTGSSDHTGRAWVTEFGDCTRVFKGHKHTVSCIKFHDGLGKRYYMRRITRKKTFYKMFFFVVIPKEGLAGESFFVYDTDYKILLYCLHRL